MHLPDHLIDPDLTSSHTPASQHYDGQYYDGRTAATVQANHYVEQQQWLGSSTQILQQEQLYLNLTEQETNAYACRETPPHTTSRTILQGNDDAFQWYLNDVIIDDLSQLDGGENIDSAGMGTGFPPDDDLPQQSVEDADFGNINVSPGRLHHAQSSPQLSFRNLGDYGSITPYDEHGVAKALSAPGTVSSWSSQSNANGSVDGGKFPCPERNCKKMYGSKSALRYIKINAWTLRSITDIDTVSMHVLTNLASNRRSRIVANIVEIDSNIQRT